MLKSQHPHGFTLVELMITLAVVAIVVSIAAPSMGQFIRENRAATQANNVLASIQLARSEAINRNMRVTMRSIAGGGAWEDGWTIFTDWNGNGVFDGDPNDKDCSVDNQECILMEQEALPNGMTLEALAASYLNGMTFLPSGEVRGLGGLTTGRFELCAPLTNQRDIVIGPGGRPRVETEDAPCP